MVRENFERDVLSQLQRVMDNPRFLLSGECDPVRAGDRVRVYARRCGRSSHWLTIMRPSQIA